MDRQNHSTPIESIMSTTMENLKDMIDVNVVVGDAVETGAGATIIPISRVSFGFVSGGGEYGTTQPKLPFAGGAGTGVSVNPMGFLVVNDGGVKLLPAQYMAPIDRVIEMLPELMGDIKNSIRSGRERKSAPGVSKSGLPDYSNMQKNTYPTETGMYVTPENVPCEVCDETARSMHPTTQGSFEDLSGIFSAHLYLLRNLRASIGISHAPRAYRLNMRRTRIQAYSFDEGGDALVAAHKSPRLMRVLRILMALTILFAILMAILIINLQPTALNLAEAKARALATDALNDAIASVMDQNIDYGDLMQITYDSTGKVSMLCANTMRMNELGSRIVLKAQSNLNAASAQVIRIPLGAASGMAIFEGTGPNISIKMLPVGSVNTEFKTEFQSAGINQTRHKIYLEATARVDLVLPNNAESIAIRTQVPVAESIIIGDVPDSYVDVADNEDMLNMIPD